jgi:hypothetical protein
MSPGMAMALAPPGIGVPDWPPPFRYAIATLPEMLRRALPAIEEGLGDEVAWCYSLGDRTRVEVDHRGREVIRLAPTLLAYRVCHGNRKGRRRR